MNSSTKTNWGLIAGIAFTIIGSNLILAFFMRKRQNKSVENKEIPLVQEKQPEYFDAEIVENENDTDNEQ